MVVVNGILTNSGAESCYDNSSAGGVMIWRFWEMLWDDPDAALRKLLHREEEAMTERQDRERIEERKKHEDRDEADTFVVLALVSEERLEALRRLSDDIDDAMRAARLAHERAQLEETRSREALELAKANAIVLPDGRRVYFTRDDERLVTEEGVELADPVLLRQARDLHREKPNATPYELYSEKSCDFEAASARVQKLAAILDRLDDVRAKSSDEHLSTEAFARRRKELDDIVESMPTDVHEEYERMHLARNNANNVSYREVDSAPTDAPILREHFARADAAFTRETADAAGEPAPERDAAYKSAPDF
jgi:hypothetical protein